MKQENAPFHPLKGPYLRQISPGDTFVGFYVVRRKDLEQFRDPSRGRYLTLILGDRTGQRLARVWENAETVAAQVEVGSVVKIQGEMETYMDKPQIRVLRIRPARESEYDWRDMLPTSQRDTEEMLNEVYAAIETIKNPYLRALLEHFYHDEEFVEALRWAPAGRKVHHSYLGGLLEHLTEMLAIAETVLRLYPEIDADLLRAGILLHDIGKIYELSWGMSIEYTPEGRLIGHVVLGDELITSAIAQIPDFPPETAMRLRHMVLAHHNRYEWGAPRRPQTLEAIALAKIDDLSSQVNRFKLLLEQSEPGEVWTPYDHLLERRLYVGEPETGTADSTD